MLKSLGSSVNALCDRRCGHNVPQTLRSQRFFARPRPTPSPTVTCSSAAASAPEPAAVPATLTFKDRLTAFVRPIPNDPEANKRVWALCVVQLFWSVSTLMYASYLAIYLREVLHLSNTSIGQLEAAGLLFAKIATAISGILGDILSHSRMIVVGAFLSLICKPMFAITGTVMGTFGAPAAMAWVATGKVSDKMSKGVRDTPLKALISKEAGEYRTAAFGLKNSVANLGMAIGSIIAAQVFFITGRNFEFTFALAAIPAVIAFVLLIIVLPKDEEAEAKAEPAALKKPKSLSEQLASTKETLSDIVKTISSGQLSSAYWQALLVVGVLYLARFELSFVQLRLSSVHFPKELIPIILTINTWVQVFGSNIFGAIAQQGGVKGRNLTFIAGCAVLVAANAAFALTNSHAGMILGTLLVGVHMAMTHAITQSFAAAYVPENITGTGFSLGDLILGGFLFAGNIAAGRLSDISDAAGMGPIGCFGLGSVAATAAGALLLLFSTAGSLGSEDKIVRRSKGKKKGKTA